MGNWNNNDFCKWIYCFGPTGPIGINSTKNIYLVTFNDGTNVDGILVKSNSALPINRKELDIYGLINLDISNSTIQFNEIGYYKITAIASLSLKKDTIFNSDTDFITLGFKVANTDNVYIGASEWRNDENARQIVMHGVIAVNNLDEQYEVVNLGNKDIYLNSPDLNNIKSDSYFTNSLVTIIIEYMGR